MNGQKVMDDSSIKIMVCTHKDYVMPADSIYLPIQVGKKLSDLELGIQSDQDVERVECDNISSLNPLYCEMTAMYWAWKNIRKVFPDVQYVGLCHYRRYFSAENHVLHDGLRMVKKFVKTSIHSVTGKEVASVFFERTKTIHSLTDERFMESTNKLKSLIPSADITTTIPIRFFCCNVREFFSVIGRIYIDLLIEIVSHYYPDYTSALNSVLRGTSLCTANMIILKTGLLDEYCMFVFGVLEKHMEMVKERAICLDPEREGIYSRVPGYLAEILTSTFIETKKNEAKILYTEKYFVRVPKS